MDYISDKEFYSYINGEKCYELISKYVLTDSQLETFFTSLDFKPYIGIISQHQLLSEEFIKKHKDSLNWDYISVFQILSEKFIEDNKDKINWNVIAEYQLLSEPFIEKYKDKLNLDQVSQHQKLSEAFVEKHIKDLNLYKICKFQKLSESFIEKYLDKLPLNCILKYQILSEKFFENHVDILDNLNYSDNIIFYQNYSNEFAEKHNLLKSFVGNRESYNKSIKAIKSCKKYECFKDYFIAYKAIRADRYSYFNFQYQYLPGETYESNCDCTSIKDSFGLNVGTYDFAKNYLGNKKGLIVKCKVYYKDIGRIVYDGEKIRCFKITVLD